MSGGGSAAEGVSAEGEGASTAAFGGNSAAGPLQGLLVLDFSQFLSGPSAALRLADLGARVVKIERPGTGDICRTLYISNCVLDGDSSIFHAINRNKLSLAADLKRPDEADRIRQLVGRADVLIQNFRPGVMEKLGFDYASVQAINPAIVYGEITGYGKTGPWRERPGQDLLVQSRSGLAWPDGDAGQPPAPFGLAAADMMAGVHLAQGILAGLVRRSITGRGSHVEVSLLESTLDLQCAELTMRLNGGSGGDHPRRSAVRNAHAYAEAPCGIYPTADGFLAIGLCPPEKLRDALDRLPPEQAGAGGGGLPRGNSRDESDESDEMKQRFARILAGRPTGEWLAVLESADIPCADVLDWERLMAEDGFRRLDMVQSVRRTGGPAIRTTRCPIRIDGARLRSDRGSPRVGEHTKLIWEEMGFK